MEYHINDERQAFINARGKVILKACPGSGKTTTVAYKLVNRIPEHEIKYGKYSGIACLSFTNSAKDEIEEKYKSFSNNPISYPHIVSTIDSFINKYIVLPHYYLLCKSIKRPKLLEHGYSINDFPLFFLDKYKRDGTSLRYIYNPSDISISKENSFLFNGKSPTCTGVELTTFNAYAKELKQWQFNKGYLTPNDTNYAALALLKTFPKIAKSLIQRFPTLIIDEGQDTSEIQFAIFDILIENGLTNIEIIGDPYQSLYEWREARPDLFEARFQDSVNWTPLKLNRCRRSVQKIINQYQILRNEDSALISELEENDVPITILRYNEGAENETVDKYLEISQSEKEKCIAVRGNTLLNKLLGRSEKNISPWKSSIPYKILVSYAELKKGNTKKAINEIRKIIPELTIPTASFDDKKIIIDEIRTDNNTNSKLFKLIANIPKFDKSLMLWTTETQQLLKDTFSLENLPNFEIKQGIWRPQYNTPLKDVMEFKEFTDKPVSTIHQIKGKTFDSILLFLSKNSSGQNISITDIQKPDGFPDEKKRMIYVAMSRPRHQLVIATCNNKSEDEIKTVFGEDIEIININNNS